MAPVWQPVLEANPYLPATRARAEAEETIKLPNLRSTASSVPVLMAPQRSPHNVVVPSRVVSAKGTLDWDFGPSGDAPSPVQALYRDACAALNAALQQS